MKLSDIYNDAIIILSGHFWDFGNGARRSVVHVDTCFHTTKRMNVFLMAR